MKRIILSTVLFVSGFAATSAPLFAQSTESSNWFTGQVYLRLLGRDDVASSKFQEYREVPKGVSMPVFSVQGRQNGRDFALFGRNISQSNQRYSGWANVGWFGVSFDYNQIPHNMGNDGQTFLTETAQGVWNMSATLRNTLGDTVDATLPTSARNYAFYSNLLAPTIASAGYVDISGLRERGEVTVDLARNLPFDLALTYMRELKTGARGASGGDILGAVTSAIDVLEPMNELTQDVGVRFAYNFDAGNVHATFNRNLYNDRVDSLVVDNPFRATDLAYTSSSAPGGPGQVRFSTYPDNEASRGAFGVLLKFKRQTRIAADVALGRWTQDAQFLPFTINTAIITPSGTPATSASLLPQASLNGKIDTTTLNFSFTSRPVEGLGVRLRYRSYDLTNKTTPIDWTGGSTSGSPDRSWGTRAASEEEPYGYATANLYDNSTKRFDAQIGYDINDLTVEAAFRTAKLERTYREATEGNENGYALSALYNTNEWLGVRLVYDWLHRTAKNWDPATSLGLQADEAEKKTNRTGVDIELTPSSTVGFVFSYYRKKDDYPDRPMRVAGNPETTVGLLEASYDTYTAEVDFTPNARAEVSAYYTYEKNAQTNRWVTLTSGNINNQLRYDGRDKADTFGLNGVFHLVPEQWTFSLMLQHQKVDGLMDVTSNTTGSFYTGRATLNPPGPQDITDFDDTKLTTAVADLAYAFAEAWTFNIGYAYDKYSHADAYSDGTTIFPQSVLFFLKGNDGGYTANIFYTALKYRW